MGHIDVPGAIEGCLQWLGDAAEDAAVAVFAACLEIDPDPHAPDVPEPGAGDD